jgi:hypothetical protein
MCVYAVGNVCFFSLYSLIIYFWSSAVVAVQSRTVQTRVKVFLIACAGTYAVVEVAMVRVWCVYAVCVCVCVCVWSPLNTIPLRTAFLVGVFSSVSLGLSCCWYSGLCMRR